MAKLEIRTDPVPLREDLRDAIRIGPTRVTLHTLIAFYKQGLSPEELVECFDTLKLADVYSVIGYYLRHQAEVDAYLDEVDRESEAFRREMEAQSEYKE